VLIKKCGAWPDKGHIADQYTPQLGQLIEAGSSKEPPGRREKAPRILNEMGGHLGYSDRHGTEFRHQKYFIPPANTLGDMKNRPGRFESDEKRTDDEKRC
jgi:hypothetical protein